MGGGQYPLANRGVMDEMALGLLENRSLHALQMGCRHGFHDAGEVVRPTVVEVGLQQTIEELPLPIEVLPEEPQQVRAERRVVEVDQDCVLDLIGETAVALGVDVEPGIDREGPVEVSVREQTVECGEVAG